MNNKKIVTVNLIVVSEYRDIPCNFPICFRLFADPVDESNSNFKKRSSLPYLFGDELIIA